MLFNYSQKFLCIIIFFLSFYILVTFYIYSAKGDMDNIIKDVKNLKKIKDKDEIIDKLFLIIAEENSTVKWPLTLTISIIVASLIIL